jgi:predicted esterase
MALDQRIHFGCSSGAACSYRYKMTHHVGIEMAEVIPGFAPRFDIEDLAICMASRHVLLLSATEDDASQDADDIVRTVRNAYAAMGVEEHLDHKRYEGGHALTEERFEAIVHWLVMCASSVS